MWGRSEAALSRCTQSLMSRAAVLAASATAALAGYAYTQPDPAQQARDVLGTAVRTGRVLRWAGASAYHFQCLQWASSASERTNAAAAGDQAAVSPHQQAALALFHQQCAAELSAVCRQNGGVYVKAAQFASNLSAVPAAYRDELGQLVDDCHPVALSAVRAVIQSELGQPIEAIFRRFDEVPVAAASLAQVRPSLQLLRPCLPCCTRGVGMCRRMGCAGA